MLDLNNFRYFVEVVDRGGLAAAGRALQRPVSTLSYRLRMLERELGLALFTRSPRRLALTESGAEFYSHAVATLERSAQAEMAMRARNTVLGGTVRFSVAVSVSQFALPRILAEFFAAHPQIGIQQHVSDETVDIVRERFDFVLRAHTGTLPDSALVQRPLAQVPWHLFASPKFVERKGPPRQPSDIDVQETLFLQRGQSRAAWDLAKPGNARETARLELRPRMQTSCVPTLIRIAEAGHGIVALPAYVCQAAVEAGRLMRVLPRWQAGDSTISALLPGRIGASAAARTLIAHFASRLPGAVAVPDTEAAH